MVNPKESNFKDFAAIILAMTDSEQPYLADTLKAVLEDPSVAQIILCIEKTNNWIDAVISGLPKDSRLEMLRLDLAPPGAIRNQAVNNAKMPWIAFCDGDDIWLNGKITQRKYAEETGADFIGTDNYLIDESGNVLAFAMGAYMPCLSSWMVKTAVMKKFPFDESKHVAEDSRWWYQTEGKIKKVRLPKIQLKYRVRKSSVSSNTPSKARKLKIINLASIPLLGKSVYAITYFIWLLNRKSQYDWKKSFGNRPAFN